MESGEETGANCVTTCAETLLGEDFLDRGRAERGLVSTIILICSTDNCLGESLGGIPDGLADALGVRGEAVFEAVSEDSLRKQVVLLMSL